MTITTVGELIEALKQFDLSTPVIKNDPTGPGYFNINITENMTFDVAADGMHHGFDYYRDAHEKSSAAGPDFAAVVL